LGISNLYFLMALEYKHLDIGRFLLKLVVFLSLCSSSWILWSSSSRNFRVFSIFCMSDSSDSISTSPQNLFCSEQIYTLIDSVLYLNKLPGFEKYSYANWWCETSMASWKSPNTLIWVGRHFVDLTFLAYDLWQSRICF
jgi:hypothetical protein